MKATPKKPLEDKRDHAVEKHMAITRRAARMADVRQKRDDGLLSQELFQVSQALILCGLPYQPTTERHFTRRARLGDGSTVSVTFSTALEAAMPYGSDRTLLHFLMDRAVKTGSRFVSWETATEFLNTMNLATGGKNRRDLRERFRRIAGLTIGVERKTADSYSGRIMPVIGDDGLGNAAIDRQHRLRRRDRGEVLQRSVGAPRPHSCRDHQGYTQTVSAPGLGCVFVLALLCGREH
jgi:hypothetical protein